MKLYGYEVNTCNYKNFKMKQLKNFRSMLKSNIKNFENIIEPTIEEMIDEDPYEITDRVFTDALIANNKNN